MRQPDFSRPLVYPATGIPPGALDPDAVRVVERLQSAGFEAYLVGGCVRDLLLGRQPKDFDVATSARPRQIRRLFRHCRIIGRRFKLAHVVFRRPDGTEHIVETATFRQAPPPQEEGQETLLITDDNTFGTAAEDAARRDFTINALFLDPRASRIIDFVHGLPDLQARRLAAIGDPNIRLREDPVRILRAIKFASRLGFRIAKETYEGMVRHADDLAMAAVPRLLEEILRLLRGGHAYPAFRLVAECGAMRVILPEIAGFLTAEWGRGPAGQRAVDFFWRDLQALDEAVHAGDPVAPAFLHALLLYRPFERECDPRRRTRPGAAPPSATALAAEILEPHGRRLRVPKLDVARAREILAAQPRFRTQHKKHFRPGQFTRHDCFPEALALLRVHCVSEGEGWDLYEGWYQLYRRKQGDAAPRRGASLDAPEAAPAESEAGFHELWGLPAGEAPQEREEREPARAPKAVESEAVTPPAVSQPAVPAEAEARPAATEPEVEPRLADPATVAMATAMDGVRSRRQGAREPAPRAPREMLRFKIARPDARFEFPAQPYLAIEEGPSFGDW